MSLYGLPPSQIGDVTWTSRTTVVRAITLFLCLELSMSTRVRNRRVFAIIEPFMHRGFFPGLVAFATTARMQVLYLPRVQYRHTVETR